MPNSGPSNNRNFGNRNDNQNTFGNPFTSDRFQMNQVTNSNFYDDFDFNEMSRDISNLDRHGGNSGNGGNGGNGGNNRNFNPRKNFQNNFNDDSFGNSSMNFNNQNARGGNNNMNAFSGNSNDRFNNGNNGNNGRNMNNDDDQQGGQHCIHMRGLPYYSDEMDVFNVSY